MKREQAITHIMNAACHYDEDHLLSLVELIGFNVASPRVTMEMLRAVVETVLPLHDDDRLQLLVTHVNELHEMAGAS